MTGPAANPWDLGPGEAAREAEARLRLDATGITWPPGTGEVEERIRRLVLGLIRQRDEAVVHVAAILAQGLRVEASKLDVSNPFGRVAFAALVEAAVSTEGAAVRYATRGADQTTEGQ